MRLDISRLEKVKRNPDQSITCRCPACAAEGGDKTGNHLRIWTTGAFNCVTHGQDKVHNRTVRALLRGTSLDDNPDTVYIDPEPTIKIDKVYPEDTLSKLLPDYTYWLNRGARPEVVKELEGGLAPLDEKSKLAGRFVFPVRAPDGRIAGFIGRLTVENSFAPKWKNLVKTSRVVWPWKVAAPAIAATKTVVLLESPGDLIACMGAGIRNALCIFGLNINSRVISTLVSVNVNRIVISLNRDDDPTKGQRAAEKIADRLSAFFAAGSVQIILPPEGVKDWGIASVEQLAAFKESIL